MQFTHLHYAAAYLIPMSLSLFYSSFCYDFVYGLDLFTKIGIYWLLIFFLQICGNWLRKRNFLMLKPDAHIRFEYQTISSELKTINALINRIGWVQLRDRASFPKQNTVTLIILLCWGRVMFLEPLRRKIGSVKVRGTPISRKN